MHGKSQEGTGDKSRETQKIAEAISEIRRKIDDANEAKAFDAAVQDARKKMAKDSENAVNAIVKKYQEILTKLINEKETKEDIDLDEADEIVEYMKQLVEKLSPEFEVDLNEVIDNTIVKTGNALLEAYKQKIMSLADEIGIEDDEIKFDPFELLKGDISGLGDSIKDELKHTKKVEDGHEWVPNSDKKWYKPWTWFQESGYLRTKYRNVEFIKFSELSEELLARIQIFMFENGSKAKYYANEAADNIVQLFTEKFAHIDLILSAKLFELERFTTDESIMDEEIKKTEEKVVWLNSMTDKVMSILDI